jgi:hypothetical protein
MYSVNCVRMHMWLLACFKCARTDLCYTIMCTMNAQPSMRVGGFIGDWEYDKVYINIADV